MPADGVALAGDSGVGAAAGTRRDTGATAKVIRGAILGTIVEYYDFGIYGYMAATLSVQFFAAGDPQAALLETFAAFAVAFFLRIPGGLVFGHIGDTYGRRTALTWTLLLMAGSTFLIGLLPNYATLGIWAAALLIACRCLQGFSAGGEIGGANVFVSEHAPPHRRALQTAMVMTGMYLGSLTATMTALAVTTVFPAEQIAAWAWRIPFLLSAAMGAVGFYIRNSLHDSPEFLAVRAEARAGGTPIGTLLRSSWRKVAHLVMLYGISAAGYYISTVYIATYLQKVVGLSARVALTSTSIALVLGILVLPVAGALADRHGRKPVLIASSGAGLVLVLPMFHLMQLGSVPLAMLAQAVCFLCVSAFNGALFATFAENLGTVVRYTGVALVTNIANSLMGGTAPMLATLLIGATGNPLSPAWIYAISAAMSLCAAAFLRETRGCELAR